MFKVMLSIAGIILGIVCGHAIGDATGSGLVGFVGALICISVLLRFGFFLGAIIDEIISEASYRSRRRSYYGKTRFM